MASGGCDLEEQEVKPFSPDEEIEDVLIVDADNHVLSTGEGLLSQEEEFLDATDVLQHCYRQCRRLDADSMKLIACDGEDCSIEWYHMECVGLSLETLPSTDDKWFCPECIQKLEPVKPRRVPPIGTKPKAKVDQVSKSLSTIKLDLPKPKKDDKVKPKKVTGQNLKDALASIKARQHEVELELERTKLQKVEAELQALKAELKSDTAGKTTNQASTAVKDPERTPAEGKLFSLKDLLEKVSKGMRTVAESSDSSDSDGKPTKKSSKRRTKKSGLYKKASDEVLTPQKWSHLSLKFEYSGKDMRFSDLTLPTFVAGELEIIKVCEDEKEKTARIAFLNTLMYYSVSRDFKDIRKWYAAWVREIESGNKVWGDDFSKVGEGILTRAAIKPPLSPRSKGKKGSNSSSKSLWFCSLYQKGKCSKESPHTQKIRGVNKEVVHVCASCWLVNKEEAKHPESASSCPLRDSSDSEK